MLYFTVRMVVFRRLAMLEHDITFIALPFPLGRPNKVLSILFSTGQAVCGVPSASHVGTAQV